MEQKELTEGIKSQDTMVETATMIWIESGEATAQNAGH